MIGLNALEDWLMTLLDDYVNPGGRPGKFGGEHWSTFTAALRDAGT